MNNWCHCKHFVQDEDLVHPNGDSVCIGHRDVNICHFRFFEKYLDKEIQEDAKKFELFDDSELENL